MKIIRLLVNIMVAPLVIIVAILLASSLIKSRKPPPSRTPPTAIAIVQIRESSPQDITPTIRTFGNTRTHLATSLSSQVAGEIIEVSPKFESGLAVEKDDWLVKIDPADYTSILAERQSALATAQQSLADEKSRSRIAREDWIASGRDPEKAPPFTLRIPQLAAAQAAVDGAQAAIDKALLDIERTTISAPFDAIIQSRRASPGTVVSIGVNLGELFASESIEARLPLTPEQAARLDLPQQDAASNLTATLTTPSLPQASWSAAIERVEPSVDQTSQTIWIVGRIKEPFADSKNFLPVGAFVNAALKGKVLPEVHALPEAAVVEDNYVWIVGPGDTLARQEIELAYTGEEQIFARIAEPNFPLPLRIITRPLASFREGQKVKPQESAQP